MGRAVYQVGTGDSDYGNRDRVGDHIAYSEKTVEALRVTKNDCVGSRSKVDKFIFIALL